MLGEMINLQIQEVQRTPKLINTKKIPRHAIVKLLKNKDKDKGSPLMSIISTELSATMAFLFLHYSN